MNQTSTLNIISTANTAGLDAATRAVQRHQAALRNAFSTAANSGAVQGAARTLQRTMVGAWSAVSGAAAAAGRVIGGVYRGIATGAGVVGAAITAFTAASIGAAADFQDSMSIINTIAQTSEAQLTEWGDAMRQLAIDTGEPLDVMTQGFYDLLSAGIDSADAMGVLNAATTLAIGGLATTSETVDLLTTVLNAYGLEAAEAARVSDVMAVAIDKGKVTADQIAGTISTVAGLAANAGVEIEELAAAYATLTSRGFEAGEAMTGVRAALIAVQRMPVALGEFQVATGTDLQKVIREEGIQVAMQKLVDYSKAENVELIDMLGRIEAVNFALNVTGENADYYVEALGEAYDSQGYAAEQAAARQDDYNRAIARLGQAWQSLLIEWGTAFLPILTEAAGAVREMVEGITEWMQANRDLIKTLAPIAAAIASIAALRFAAEAMGAVFLRVGSYMGPSGRLSVGFGHIFGLVGALAFPLAILTGGFIALRNAVELGEVKLGGIAYPLRNFMRLAESVGTVVRTLGEDVMEGMAAFFQGRWSEAGDIFGGIGESLNTPMAILESRARQLFGSLERFFAEHGAAIMAWIGETIVSLVEGGAEMAAAAIDWVIDLPGKLAPHLSNAATGIFDWFRDIVPIIIDQLADWTRSFLTWAQELWPKVGTMLGNFLSSILDWLDANAPAIGQALGDWTVAFVKWVLDDLVPSVLDVLGAVIEGVSNFLIDRGNLSRIARALGEWTATAVQWVITDFVPAVVTAMAVLIVKIGAFLVENGPKVAQMFAEFIGAALEGIREAFDALDPVIRNIAAVILALLVPKFVALGVAASNAAKQLTLELLASMVNVARAAGGAILGALSTLIGRLTVLRIQAFAAGGALGSTAAGSMLAGISGLIGRIPGLTGMLGAGRGLIGALGRFAAFLPGIGTAVALFAVGYETNFLGMRDVTDDWVGTVLHNLEMVQAAFEYGQIVVDFDVSSAEAIAGVVNVASAIEERWDQMGEGLFENVDDATQHMIDGAINLGEEFGFTADEAVIAFSRIVASAPKGVEASSWIRAYRAELEGLPNEWEIRAAEMEEQREAWYRDNNEAINDSRASWGRWVQDQEAVTGEAAKAWEDYDQAVRDSLDRVRNALMGAESDINSAVQAVNEQLALELPEIDLSGMMRDEQIAYLETQLGKIPAATDAMTEAQRQSLVVLRQTMEDQITILSNGLDTLAINTGGDIDEILAEFNRLTDPEGGVGATAEEALEIIRQKLALGGLGAIEVPTEIRPKITEENTVTFVSGIEQYSKQEAQRRLLAMEPGIINVPVKPVPKTTNLPDTAVPFPTAAEVVGDTGTQIVNTVSQQMKDNVGVAENAAEDVAGAIAGILKITSEPTAGGPLRGITTWGRNMVQTIATGVMASSPLMLVAGLMTAMMFRTGLVLGLAFAAFAVTAALAAVRAPFIVLQIAAFLWGFLATVSYAAGLRAGIPIVAAAAQAVAAAARPAFEANSPPGPDSPLHLIQVWGKNTMTAFADGIRDATTEVVDATRSVMAAASNEVGLELAPVTVGGGMNAAEVRASRGGEDSARNMDPRAVELLAAMVNETKIQNTQLSKIAADNPSPPGALPARSMLEAIRTMEPVRSPRP